VTTTLMTTHTLDVPGATLTYDVRPNDASSEPILLLIGSPMGAAGFGTLSGHFTDPTCTHYEPDFDALRVASTRIVMAAGAASEGELASRGAFAVAESLGTKPVIFPSHHGGFLGGEYGYAGEPDAFAEKLREVLTASA
jgi:hypothetical protein